MPEGNVKTYLSDTNEHVEDEGFDGVGSASLLVSTEPHSNSDVLALKLLGVHVSELNFTCEMAEILGDLSTGSFNSHFPCSNRNGNYER